MDTKLYIPLKLALFIGFIFCFISPVIPASPSNNSFHYQSDLRNDSLTVERMMEIITANFPDRNEIVSTDSYILLRILDTLGIKTENDLKELFKEYLEPALESEQRICREMLEEYEENGSLSSTDGFYADEEKLENIQKGIYFMQAGIIREMLIIKYGEEMNDVIRGSDIEDEYNLEDILEYEDEYEGVE